MRRIGLAGLMTVATGGCLRGAFADGDDRGEGSWSAGDEADGWDGDEGDGDGDGDGDPYPFPYPCDESRGPGIERCDPVPEVPAPDLQHCPPHLAPTELLASEGFLYWRNARDQAGEWATTILRMDALDGSVETFFDEQSLGSPVNEFAVFGGRVFVATPGSVFEGSAGGEVTPLFDFEGTANAIAADGAAVYLGTSHGLSRLDLEQGVVSTVLSGQPVEQIVLADGAVFAAVGAAPNAIVRTDPAGVDVQVLVPDARVVEQMIVDADQLYWRAAPGCGWEGGFDILEIPATGGDPVDVWLHGIAREMAIDGGSVFVLDAGMTHAGVHGAALQDGCFAPLAVDEDPATIAVADGRLWVAYTGGCIDGIAVP